MDRALVRSAFVGHQIVDPGLFLTALLLCALPLGCIDVQSAAGAVRLVKQAKSVRQGLPQALMFLGRAVKGTKLKQNVLMFGRSALSLWEPKDFGLSDKAVLLAAG
jgi:hypothetical protein